MVLVVWLQAAVACSVLCIDMLRVMRIGMNRLCIDATRMKSALGWFTTIPMVFSASGYVL